MESMIQAMLRNNTEVIYPKRDDRLRTPLCKISSTGEIEQRFRLN